MISATSKYLRRLVYIVFLRSDTVATIYFTASVVRLLFEGGVYFFGKPGDINDSLDKAHTSETVMVC